MSTRTLLVTAGLLLVLGAATSQPTAPKPTPVAPPPPTPVGAGAPVIPVASSYSAPAREMTVDDLLNELELVQAQKAQLEKREQDLKAVIRKKLDAQAERLKKLGVAPPAAKEAKEPDRVGQITIEGNTRTPDEKILEKLDLRPGQVLVYPALAAARARLEKAGFTGVVVETMPNDLDAVFKDIRVKVTEAKQP